MKIDAEVCDSGKVGIGVSFEDYSVAIDRRKATAMEICGIFDEDEVSRVEPVSYIQQMNGHMMITVWMFGNKKIYSAMFELQPDEAGDATSPGRTFFDVYRFKNIVDIRVDDFGCVISMRTGKKLELKSNTYEGSESFLNSAHGLVSLWDEYDD